MMQLIKSINKSRVEGIQVFHNSIDKNLNIFESSLKEEFIKKLQRKYLPKAIEILGKINPKKLDLYDYSDFTLIITNKNKKFPINMKFLKNFEWCYLSLSRKKTREQYFIIIQKR